MERVREALEVLDLESWLSQYSDMKGGGDTEVRLQECPKCGDDRYKLYVNTEKKLWLCYVCDWGRGLGDVVQLMAAVSNRSLSDVRIELMRLVIPAPVGDLAEKLNALFAGEEPEETKPFAVEPVDLPGSESFAGMTTRHVLNYALRRGLTEQQVTELRLRASGSLHIHKASRRPVKISGPFLVFPIYCNRVPVAWQGRRIINEDPKYVSASNIKEWLWPLEPLFFDHYRGSLILVEGVFDALGLLYRGLPALCTFGKSISDRQINLLHDLQPSEVVFAWDFDAYREMAKAVDRIAYSFAQTKVASLDRTDGLKKDPGDALLDAEVGTWILECLEQAMDVRSPEFFQWRMSKL